ncbi:hypothetical protein MTO96_013439 [Rhipicephalus appendiculatus]
MKTTNLLGAKARTESQLKRLHLPRQIYSRELVVYNEANQRPGRRIQICAYLQFCVTVTP